MGIAISGGGRPIVQPSRSYNGAGKARLPKPMKIKAVPRFCHRSPEGDCRLPVLDLWMKGNRECGGFGVPSWWSRSCSPPSFFSTARTCLRRRCRWPA